MKNTTSIKIEFSINDDKEEGAIYIYDQDGEVLMWDIAEWREDEDTQQAILAFVNEAITEGTADIRKRVHHLVGYDGTKKWWERGRYQRKVKK